MQSIQLGLEKSHYGTEYIVPRRLWVGGPQQRPLRNRIHGMSRGFSQNKPKLEQWRLRRDGEIIHTCLQIVFLPRDIWMQV